MRQILLLVTALCSLSACNKTIRTVDNDEFESILRDTSVILLDVRTPEEYVQGHIPGAINVDVKQKYFVKIAKEKLVEGSTVAVYCKGGVRSMKAAKMLSKEGYQIVNLKNGFDSWTTAKKQKTSQK